MAQLEPGTVVDGRFEVIDQIGHGGMGIVYRARHIGMQRDVAMKVLKSDLAGDSDKLQRFRREAQVISVLDHPNIVQIYAIGMIKDGQPYIAMEFLPGDQLSDVITRNGPIKWRDALPLFMQICDALEYAHKMNIIHRDIKPSNIVLLHHDTDERTTVKLVDFGIAKSLTDAGPQLTQTEMVLGSIFYLSPGQFQGRAADHRSDIYSLACTFFEVITGVPPFKGDSAFETAAKQVSDQPPTVASKNSEADVPDDLEFLLHWMLEKDPEQRPASIAAVKANLQHIVAGQRITRPDTAIGGKGAKQKANAQTKRRAISIAVASLAAIGTAAAVVFFHGKQQQQTAPRTQENFTSKAESELVNRLKAEIATGRPNVFPCYVDLMNCYREQEKYLKVQMTAERALEQMSKTRCQPSTAVMICQTLSDGYLHTGRWQDALDASKRADKFINGDGEAPYHARLALAFQRLQICMETHDWREAVKQLELMNGGFQHGYSPGGEGAFEQIWGGQTYCALKQWDKALAYVKMARPSSSLGVQVVQKSVAMEVADATTSGISQKALDDFVVELQALTDSSYKAHGLVSAARIAARHQRLEQAQELYRQAAKAAEHPLDPHSQYKVWAYTLVKQILNEWRTVAPTSRKLEIDKLLFEADTKFKSTYLQANDRRDVQLPF